MDPTMPAQEQPVMVATQLIPLAPPQPPGNLSTIKGLAITQLVIGILALIFGIASVSTMYGWGATTGAGIWGGMFITVAGIIGVFSSRYYNNNCLTGVYMAFSIVSTCASLVAGIFCVLAALFPWDWDEYGVNFGIHIPLALMMAVEFFVSIAAEILCCQSCCRRHQQVMMVAMPTNTTGTYPANIMVPQYGTQFVPQYNVQIQPQYITQVPPAYSAQGPDVNQQQHPHQINADLPEKPPEYTAQ